MAYFPMFIDLKDRICLVAGGGPVALRKVHVLLDFEARVVICAPEICQALRVLGEQEERVTLFQREFQEADLADAALVVAATDDRMVNHRIAELGKKAGIPVNAVDQPEDCTFFFSSYIREKDMVAAFSSSGNTPILTQYLKGQSKNVLTPFIGELGEYLGKIRPDIYERYPGTEERTAFYRNLIRRAIEFGEIPEEDICTTK